MIWAVGITHVTAAITGLAMIVNGKETQVLAGVVVILCAVTSAIHLVKKEAVNG